MKRMGVLAVVTAGLITATAGWVPAGASPAPVEHSTPAGLTATPVKTGLANPAGFTFLPDGRIVYGERNTGNVMLLDPQTGKQSTMYTISNVRSNGEQGLLGLAVDPKWPKKPFIYAYATRQMKTLQNQILKITVSGDKGVSQRVIWRLDTTPGTYHDGTTPRTRRT